MDGNYQDLSDEDLMKLYCKGDSKAFDTLYARHSGRVYGYFQKKSNSLSPADLLQDTFLKLHRVRDQYNPQYPFLPWLFTVAKNTLFDNARKSVRDGKRFVSQESFDHFESRTEVALDFGSELSSAVGRLDNQQKTAIELRYLQDWSFEEIAQKLRTTPENARQIVSRGLKKMKNLLGVKGGPHES